MVFEYPGGPIVVGNDLADCPVGTILQLFIRLLIFHRFLQTLCKVNENSAISCP